MAGCARRPHPPAGLRRFDVAVRQERLLVRGAAHILIIDHHELFSTSLRMTLRQHGWDAYQVVPTGVDAVLRAARRLGAGLALLDLHLGDGQDEQRLRGVDLIAPLRSLGWAVLVVTGRADAGSEAAAAAVGATASVLTSSRFEDLLTAVLAAAAGAADPNRLDRRDAGMPVVRPPDRSAG